MSERAMTLVARMPDGTEAVVRTAAGYTWAGIARGQDGKWEMLAKGWSNASVHSRTRTRAPAGRRANRLAHLAGPLMASFRPFGYEGKPGTCLWCGRALGREQVQADPDEPGAVRKSAYSGWSRPADEVGFSQNGFFCILSCGYLFGVRMAQIG